jgi:serine/threonine-protein kinase RsbT
VARQGIGTNAVFLQQCRLQNEDDLVEARMAIKMHAVDMAFSTMNQTKVITAASELGRNVIEHGLGGTVKVDRVCDADRTGIMLTFKDSGPGIENMELALTDGYTSKKGLGLGLTGSKRLMDDFSIESVPDQGTTVTVIKWK